MNFADALFYKGPDLKLKINNYLPQMPEELNDTVLALDTWSRELQLPKYFADYFKDTFMIPAYTCDELGPSQLAYPGLIKTYSCYCNNGDYHTMPTLNFEIREKNFQYDMSPSQYMYLPYLNYTQPMSLCILGIEQTMMNALEGIEYVSLGQRALASFPVVTIYDREKNTALIELGGATVINGAGTNGVSFVVAIAIVIIIVVLLTYLIAMRYSRIQAEQWFENNKNVLFCPIAAKLKSEHEILKRLVEGKEKGMSRDERAAIAPQGVNTENLLDYDKSSGTPTTSDKRANSVGSQKRPPTSKKFIEEYQ